MKISQLRTRLTFQQPTRVAETGGGYSTTWGDISSKPTVWGNVTPLSGIQQMKSEQLDSIITHKVTVRHRTDINDNMRIMIGDRNLAIKYMTNKDESKTKWLELLVVEGDPS